MHAATDQLPSERVIVQAPASFAGSTLRILRLTEPRNPLALRSIGAPWWRGLLYVLLDGLIVLTVGLFMVTAWSLVLLWYLYFGVLLVPYRLIRRSDRNRKRDALQHREMLDAAIATQAAANRREIDGGR